jgi:hypothetical protein
MERPAADDRKHRGRSPLAVQRLDAKPAGGGCCFYTSPASIDRLFSGARVQHRQTMADQLVSSNRVR